MDESDETPELPPFIPDELKDFILNQHEKASMIADVHRHDIVRFFHELTEQQTEILQKILRLLESNPDRLAYFDGFLQALRESKYNICAGCGVNHDAQMDALVHNKD